MYKSCGVPQSEMRAKPENYPQGYFKDKPCKSCGTIFKPQAPSHLYCSQECKDEGWSDGYLKSTYGITQKQYRIMEENQKGKCKICGSDGFLMRDWHFKKLVVDHDHKTGIVRGLLCHNCNRGIGLLQEDVTILKNAIEYLEGATTILKGSTPKRVEAHSNKCIICSKDHGGLQCPQMVATC